MIPKQSPKTLGNGKVPGAVQARLIYLRKRRSALDELILSVERYSVYPSLPKSSKDDLDWVPAGRLMGAA
jgi:hypothetical protein